MLAKLSLSVWKSQLENKESFISHRPQEKSHKYSLQSRMDAVTEYGNSLFAQWKMEGKRLFNLVIWIFELLDIRTHRQLWRTMKWKIWTFLNFSFFQWNRPFPSLSQPRRSRNPFLQRLRWSGNPFDSTRIPPHFTLPYSQALVEKLMEFRWLSKISVHIPSRFQFLLKLP